MTVPKETTRRVVAVELEGARAWAERHDVELDWDPETLTMTTQLVQPETGDVFTLVGRFDGYRARPPAWNFRDPDTGELGTAAAFPSRDRTPWGSAIFHQKPVICVPFNRLAYKECGGPHSNWGPTTGWLQAAPERAHATTVGEMLQIVLRDLRYTKGRMGSRGAS